MLYALILGFVVFHNMKWKDLKECLWNTCKSVGNLMLIVAFANAFSWVAAIEKVPDEIAALLMSISSNKYVLLMIVNVFYIFVGMIMDTGPAILVFTPVLLPVAEAIGVDPIHFGIIMCVNLAIGFVTPPMGANLFVASNLSKVSVFDIARKAVPFILAFLIALLLITFVPQISMFLLQ